MKEREQISSRLKELRRDFGFSQSYVAEKLFVSQAAYSLMEGNQNAVTAEHIVQLSKLYNLSTDFLLTGKDKMVNMTPENGFLPLIDSKAHAGFLHKAHREEAFDDFDFYRIPGYNPTKDSVLIEIEGLSMQPTIMPGEVLVCQAQKQINYVLEGSVVVVVTKDDLFASRIQKKTDNLFLLEGDNPEDPGKKILKKEEIIRLLMVLGKVSNALVPTKEMAYKGKIHDLEESVEFLSKKIYKIEKLMENRK